MKRFRVGVIGTGYIGQVHLEVLRRIPEVQVTAVMNRTPDGAETAAERFDIPKIYSDAYKLIEDSEIDVIHNCMSNNLHFDINRHAIKTGKDVLSEKPLTMDSSESAELVQLAQKHNTVTGVNFCYRYYPVVQEAAARVWRGDTGEIRAVVGHFLQDWLAFDTDYSWRLDPAVTGKSNVMADLGSHWCDLIQFMTGLSIVEVMAEFHTCIPVRKKSMAGTRSFSRVEGAE
ncbi:MAG TPA: Gfo/Idh/MocA family oxidoreductase, partial [Anaerolineae bacterium]|nr:Gfo/Idh/MocA family oxidoreductase [Anaerolineae bacterium]